jgi:hypothetical protein
VRWNAIIDTGGTPPRLRSKSRNPGELDAEIRRVAAENDCEVEIWWDRFSWAAYITIWGNSPDQHQSNADARKALEVLEAINAKQWLDLTEKSRHPNIGQGYDPAS